MKYMNQLKLKMTSKLQLKVFFLMFLHEFQTISNFPLDSFVFEANPLQKLSFPYNDKGSMNSIKFKIQAVSFKVYEQLAGFDSGKDSKLQSDDKTIEDNNFLKYKEIKPSNHLKLNEVENKYKNLNRFTVYYNNVEEHKPKATTVINSTNDKPINMKNDGKNITGSTKVTKNEICGKSGHNNSTAVTNNYNIPNTTEIIISDNDLTTEYMVDFTKDPVEQSTSIDIIPDDGTESIESSFEIASAETTEFSPINFTNEITAEMFVFESTETTPGTTHIQQDEKLPNAVIINESIAETDANTVVFETSEAPTNIEY